MKNIKQNILLLFLIVLTSTLHAQVNFTAKVSKQRLGVNERLRVDFNIDKEGDNFQEPNFDNFTLLSGPNLATSFSWINGKRSFSKTYTYFLQPNATGTFTIKAASIEVDGQIYKTNPIAITVTNAVEIPKDPNDPSFLAKDNVHLVAEVSNPNPYLNEAITVVYKLYVSESIGVDNWNETNSPRYNDFWSQNINVPQLQVQQGTYNGENYRFVVLRKVVLYPQKTGALIIDPLTLNLALSVPTNKRDFFGGFVMARTTRSVSAGNRTITVKALPEAGKPDNFTGAVGKFNFSASASKTELNASESMQVKVEVNGNGNLKLFKLPKVKVPSSLEMYEPEHTENVTTNLTGMQGSIADTYTIVPQYKGTYPIPQLSFSYFDLETKSYKEITSKEMVLNVINGPSGAHETQAKNTQNQTEVASHKPFAFIKKEPNFKSTKSIAFFKTPLFWSLLLLPFLAIPIAILIRNKKDQRSADVKGNKTRMADKLARKYLGNAKKALGEKEAFYIALEKALHNYLKAKLHIETSELSKDNISELLANKKVTSQAIIDFNSILQSCDLARYSPIDIVTMQEDYNKAAKTINLIDKQV